MIKNRLYSKKIDTVLKDNFFFTEIRKEEVMAIRNRFPTKIPVRHKKKIIVNNTEEMIFYRL